MKKFYFEIDPQCPVCIYKIEEAYANAHKWGIGENTINIDKDGKGTIECLCDPHEVADRVYFIDDNGEAYFGIVGDLISDDSEEEEEETKNLPLRNKDFSLEDIEKMSEKDQKTLFDQYDQISKKYGV